MIVVADTTPLNYLILIGEIDLLPQLYLSVLLPESVYLELLDSDSPGAVRHWAATLPPWCRVHPAIWAADASLDSLDAGERDTIQLALELNVRRLLMDELDGRQKARELHLEVTGTLGILERAAQQELISFRHALDKLEMTNFRLSGALRDVFLARNPS